jgi:hypothetical protein
MHRMSDYILAKIWWGVFLVVAACIYGFWRGWKGRPLDKTEDEMAAEHGHRQETDRLKGPML